MSDAADPAGLKGRRVKIGPIAGTWQEKKNFFTGALVLSLVLHCMLAAIFLFFAGRQARHEDMGHIITVYIGTDCPAPGLAGARPGHRPSGPRYEKHPHEAGPRIQASQPALPDHSKIARSEAAAHAGAEAPERPVSLAPSPSAKNVEVSDAQAHPAGDPVETPEAQGGGTWTGNEAGRGGTGPISPAGGGTSTGGESASGGGGPGTGSGSDAYVASQFAYIRGLIVKNLVYPGEARRAGLRGKVTVGFIIIEDGLARNIRIVESSGHDLLDRTVLDAIRRCQPFPRPPGRAELVIPIVFKLK